jgi:hypothetical protein
MRFQRLTTVYPEFAERFLARTPNVAELSYEQLYNRLTAARFAENDHHARHMRSLGHVAENCFLSLEPLQRRWAAEHSVNFRDKQWLADIAVEQVRAFQPTTCTSSIVRSARASAAHAKTVPLCSAGVPRQPTTTKASTISTSC